MARNFMASNKPPGGGDRRFLVGLARFANAVMRSTLNPSLMERVAIQKFSGLGDCPIETARFCG